MKSLKNTVLFLSLILSLFGLVGCDSTSEPDVTRDEALNTLGHKFVDLGLPSQTLWAAFNIGETDPGYLEYIPIGNGDCFAWGEVSRKSEFSWSNYEYFLSSKIYGEQSLIYLENIGDDISCTQYDVAKKVWGGDWQLPSRADFEELMKYCTFKLCLSRDETDRLVATGPNGKIIALRVRDCEAVPGPMKEGVRFLAQYWAGESVPMAYEMNNVDELPTTGPCAYAFEIDEYGYRIVDDIPKYQGCFVHPVIKRKK